MKGAFAVPERNGLTAHRSHGANRVAVVERSRERDDADPWRSGGHARPFPTASSTTSRITASSMTGFDSSRRDISPIWVVAASIDDETNILADADVGHVRPAERGQRPLDRFALRVEESGLERDLDVCDVPHVPSRPARSTDARSQSLSVITPIRVR